MNEFKKKTIVKMNTYFKKINRMSPFPIIDTGIIEEIDNKVNDNNVDYDSEPVVCCAHCKKLSIKIDDDDNEYCILCKNSINETETHATIFHYLNKYTNIWE